MSEERCVNSKLNFEFHSFFLCIKNENICIIGKIDSNMQIEVQEITML